MNLYRRVMPATRFDGLARSRFERFVLSRLENSNRWKSSGWILFVICGAGAGITGKLGGSLWAAIVISLLGGTLLFEQYIALAYYRILSRSIGEHADGP